MEKWFSFSRFSVLAVIMTCLFALRGEAVLTILFFLLSILCGAIYLTGGD